MKNKSLGIFIGESFAELTLLDTQSKEKLDFQRWYLPRANLKSFLSKYIVEKSLTKLDHVFVGHRFLEKLFSYRLGGSVAQIVTSGFEKALHFEETSISDSLIWPQKPPALSSNDLIFSINESVTSEGRIAKAVDSTALEPISAKLKLMEVKRVCLHLRHAKLNKKNLLQVQSFFEEAGFDVFTPPPVDPEMEFKSWRKNLIEAAITGTFLEIQEDIRQPLNSIISNENIHFLGANLNWFQDQKSERLGSLIALENLWTRMFPEILNSKEKIDIFHFGLENFSMIQNDPCSWELPWGPLTLSSSKRKDFQIQPTQSLKLNDNNELIFDQKELSFEPGPVTMGRGVVPCIYDILNFSDALASELQEKLIRSLQSILKNSHKSISTLQALKLLKNAVLDQLATHIEFTRSPQLKQIVVYGFIADLLEADLKTHKYFSQFIRISEKEWPKSSLIALWGLKGHQ
ncbi:MAG: hypothetical protein AABY64_08135 [Bdellovibrionota bacterium]